MPVGEMLSRISAAELADWLDTLAYPLASPAVHEFQNPGFIGQYVVTVTDIAGSGERHAGRVIVARDMLPVIALRERDEMRDRWLRQFNTAFGTDDNDEATTFNGSIPQALTLMNGDLVRRATGNQKGSMLHRVATEPSMDNADRIRYLYQVALSRLPTRQELAISNELLVARNGDVGAALQDIWWALLNTNEFILNH